MRGRWIWQKFGLGVKILDLKKILCFIAVSLIIPTLTWRKKFWIWRKNFGGEKPGLLWWVVKKYGLIGKNFSLREKGF